MVKHEIISCRKGGKPFPARYFFDVSELARELKVSRRTIQRLLMRTKTVRGRVRLQRSKRGSRYARGLNFLAILEARNCKAGRASVTTFAPHYGGGKFRPLWVRVEREMKRIAGSKWRVGIGVLLAACQKQIDADLLAFRDGEMPAKIAHYRAAC